MTCLKVDLINRALCVSQGRSEAMAQGCIQDPRFPYWPDIQARDALVLESPLLSSSFVPPLVWESASWVRDPMSSCPYCGHCSISQASSTQGLAMVTQRMVEGWLLERVSQVQKCKLGYSCVWTDHGWRREDGLWAMARPHRVTSSSYALVLLVMKLHWPSSRINPFFLFFFVIKSIDLIYNFYILRHSGISSMSILASKT